MRLKSLTSVEFDEFSNNYDKSNYFQTSKYALLMGEHGYDFEYLGLVDDNNKIIAGSLILLKKIRGRLSYGYAPNGFLLDYNDRFLLKEFTDEIKMYYSNKNVAFIKVNPLVIVGTLDDNQKKFRSMDNDYIKSYLVENRYIKLKSNLYFESSLPRFNAFIDLKNNSYDKYSKNTRNKIRKAIKRGLVFEKAKTKEFDYFLKLFPKSINVDDYFYQDMFNIFSKDDSIDIFFAKIDYEEYLINSRIQYDKEIERNTALNEQLINNPSDNIISEKMNSDLTVLSYKNDILEGTKGLKEGLDNYVAGAIVLKHKNTVYLISSWYDKKYSKFDANYFLHDNIINYYKDDFDYLELNGFTGDLTERNPYHGLNRFKLGFNPKVYEYIGEFDLIINYNDYVSLQENGLLAQEFNKKA